jgi:hypothetical protein
MFLLPPSINKKKLAPPSFSPPDLEAARTEREILGWNSFRRKVFSFEVDDRILVGVKKTVPSSYLEGVPLLILPARSCGVPSSIHTAKERRRNA